jgi:hypothetical protein
MSEKRVKLPKKAAGAGWPRKVKRGAAGDAHGAMHTRGAGLRELGCITAIPTTLRATKRSSSGDIKMRKSPAASRVLRENDRKKGFSEEKDAAPKRGSSALSSHSSHI